MKRAKHCKCPPCNCPAPRTHSDVFEYARSMTGGCSEFFAVVLDCPATRERHELHIKLRDEAGQPSQLTRAGLIATLRDFADQLEVKR